MLAMALHHPISMWLYYFNVGSWAVSFSFSSQKPINEIKCHYIASIFSQRISIIICFIVLSLSLSSPSYGSPYCLHGAEEQREDFNCVQSTASKGHCCQIGPDFPPYRANLAEPLPLHQHQGLPDWAVLWANLATLARGGNPSSVWRSFFTKETRLRSLTQLPILGNMRQWAVPKQENVGRKGNINRNTSVGVPDIELWSFIVFEIFFGTGIGLLRNFVKY